MTVSLSVSLPRAPEVLLLDLDDTLLDGSYLSTSVHLTCAALAERNRELGIEQLVAANGEEWQGYWPAIEEAWTLGALASEVVRDEVWRRTLRRCGCDDDALVSFAAATHARTERESFTLYDDATQLLAPGAVDLPLGLVTNGASDVQREKLRVLGIEERFSVIVVSGEVGVRKPDPAVFEVALASLGADPSAAWHVGDNLRSDVGGARACGVTAVWLNRSRRPKDHEGVDPTFEIQSLRELPALLADR